MVAGGVAVAEEEVAAGRAEGQGLDRRIELAHDQQTATQHVPGANRAVVSTADEVTAGRVEGDRVDLLLVPGQFEHNVLRFRVPQIDRVVDAGPGEVLSGRVEGHGVNAGIEDEFLLPGRYVPNDDGAV